MGDDIQTHALFILRAGDEPRRRAVSVAANMASRAAVYSSQRLKDLMSIGELPDFTPSSMRSRRRRSCSCGETSSQYLSRIMPGRPCRAPPSARRRGTSAPPPAYKAHHPFDAGAVIPAAIENHDFAGRRELDIALKVELAFSRSVGEATTRKIRGLTRSVMALMVPPFRRRPGLQRQCTLQSLVYYPALQFHQLNVEFAQRSYALLSSGAIFVAVSTDYRFSCCPSPCSVLPRYPLKCNPPRRGGGKLFAGFPAG